MPNIGFSIRHLAFSLGFCGLKGHLYFNPPRASPSLSVGPTERCPGLPGATLGWPTRRLAHPVCPENEICAAPIGICRHIWVVLLV